MFCREQNTKEQQASQAPTTINWAPPQNIPRGWVRLDVASLSSLRLSLRPICPAVLASLSISFTGGSYVVACLCCVLYLSHFCFFNQKCLCGCLLLDCVRCLPVYIFAFSNKNNCVLLHFCFSSKNACVFKIARVIAMLLAFAVFCLLPANDRCLFFA